MLFFQAEEHSTYAMVTILWKIAQSKSNSSSKSKKVASIKASTLDKFKKSAKELGAQMLKKRQKEMRAIQQKLSEAKAECTRAKISVDVLCKEIDSKWRTRQETKLFIETGVESLVRSSEALTVVGWDSAEMVSECNEIKKTVRNKLATLDIFLSNVEKESREATRIMNMMTSLQTLAAASSK